MPLAIVFIREIKKYIVSEWKRIVREAEEKHSREALGSVEQIAKIRETAQLQLVHELAGLKGEGLSATELEYALDLFHTLCSTSIDYFKLLKRDDGIAGVLQKIRQMTIMEQTVV
jgi:hypothetical protein